MAEIVGIVIEIGKCFGSTIKRQFTYLCCFNGNIQSLRDEAQNLEDKRVGLQREVEAAHNNAQVILPEVETWLENASNKIQVGKSGIDDKIPTVSNGCWGIKSRYRLSRKAVKITGEMKQLVEKRSEFDHISTSPPPAAQGSIPPGTTYLEFQSRKQIEEDIMKALRAKEVRMMGICGMGGVGKTTMAKNIMLKVREEDLFDEVVMAVVSQPVDMSKIQLEIADELDLKLDKQTLKGKAHQLRARLTGKKRILIVLDDVWEVLKLEDLGIPCEVCTILLTSRNRDVLTVMDAQKICGMEILPETEAWLLFKEKAGTCVEDANLLSTAKKVARECKGLPIALVTVGSALKEKTSIRIWEDALQQLQNSNPEDMKEVIDGVYKALILSYTYLENRHAESFFLLCGIFPEDKNISLEELTWYCMGLRMFGGITNLEQVRNRVFKIVDTLQSRFLLLKGKDELHVRMHDVVRDVAIYIASKEAKKGVVDVKFNSMRSSREYTYEWVSVFSEELSSLLRMHGSNWQEKFEIEDFSIFEGIKNLNLLSFQYISLKSLPLEIPLLKNLRTLRLESCKLESDLSVVGELLSLEILCCPGCDGFEELPVEIGKLNQLKLLDFSYCTSLKRIPPGIISNLVELEEFKMLVSFSGWELAEAEVQGEERRNACLNEFENLSKLSCLEIIIKDFNLAAEEIHFSPNISKYYIAIGQDRFQSTKNEKFMFLNLPREINLGSWVLKFLKSANELDLKGDGSKPLDLPQADSIKSLEFEDCSTVKELVNSTTSIDDRSKFDVFPILEDLSLHRLPNLEAVYDGPLLDQSNSFKNLEWLYLTDLPALKYLCKRPNRNVSLDKLRSIAIRKCNNLLNLFSFTMANDVSLQVDRQNPNVDDLLCTQQVFFPMLESLELGELDNLEVIWNAPIPEGSNSFKNLERLELYNLPALTHLWRSLRLNVSLSNLSEINIGGCHKLRNLFSSTMSMNFLSQLAKLEITDCQMMEHVLLNEEEDNDRNPCRTIQFSKLSQLKLFFLESLTVFSEGIESIEFPKLDSMDIKNCPKLINLLSSTGNNQISIEGHDDDTFHLFCCQKISFGSLKEISITLDDKSNIWCHQIPPCFFGQLEVLKISDSSSIRSLFSSSIAENLVNLKKLKIKKCKEMVKVIEDDGKILYEKSHLLFPNLKKLRCYDLPKLENFCNMRCDLQFPSLKEVKIEHCHLLEFFSMKSVTTPNLQSIEMDDEEKDVGDLNSAIQLHFEANQRQLISTEEESTPTEASEVEEDH